MDAEIGPDTLRERLDGDARVVDLRSPEAYAREHLPGSENVPFEDVVRDVERFAGEDRVVTVCPHGQASAKAARLIASFEGFDGRVESFEPGLTAWDGPVEGGAGETDHGPDGDTEERAPF